MKRLFIALSRAPALRVCLIQPGDANPKPCIAKCASDAAKCETPAGDFQSYARKHVTTDRDRAPVQDLRRQKGTMCDTGDRLRAPEDSSRPLEVSGDESKADRTKTMETAMVGFA